MIDFCPTHRSALHEALDSNLPPGDSLAGHLKTCTGCSTLFHQLQSLHGSLLQRPRASAPEGFNTRVMAYIQESTARERRLIRRAVAVLVMVSVSLSAYGVNSIFFSGKEFLALSKLTQALFAMALKLSLQSALSLASLLELGLTLVKWVAELPGPVLALSCAGLLMGEALVMLVAWQHLGPRVRKALS